MIGGLCSICGKPSKSMQTCQLCGALVCENHIREGICERCRSGRKLEGKETVQ